MSQPLRRLLKYALRRCLLSPNVCDLLAIKSTACQVLLLRHISVHHQNLRCCIQDAAEACFQPHRTLMEDSADISADTMSSTLSAHQEPKRTPPPQPRMTPEQMLAAPSTAQQVMHDL